MTKPLWRESARQIKSPEMMKNVFATLYHFCLTGRMARGIGNLADKFDKCEAGMVLERGHEFLEITKEICDERGIDVSDIVASLDRKEKELGEILQRGEQNDN